MAEKDRLRSLPSKVTAVEPGEPEHDEWGRKMWDLPDVTYYECGRVTVDDEVHESDACKVIASMRPVVEAAVRHRKNYKSIAGMELHRVVDEYQKVLTDA